jgi:hypothetical protein
MAFGFGLQIRAARVAASAGCFVALALAGVHCAAQQAAPAKPAHHPAPFHFAQPEPINFDDHDGWTQIFDGKTLTNWDGDADVWHVEAGAIVGAASRRTSNSSWR